MAIAPLNPAGLKFVPATPVPDQVPPGSPVINADKFIIPAASQIVPGVVHAELKPGVTEILCVDVSSQGAVPIVYVTFCVPTAGSKLFPVTPIPDQVPPGVPVINVLRFTSGEPEHNPAGVVHVGSTSESTVIFCVEIPTQGATPTEYEIEIGPLKPVGSKLFPVTPVPDQVPPGSPVINAERFTIPLVSQIVPGLVHAGLKLGVMVIV